MKKNIKGRHRKFIGKGDRIVHNLSLILSILYLCEGEGSYSYVHGDLGKFVAECTGPCRCVHRVGRSCI